MPSGKAKRQWISLQAKSIAESAGLADPEAAMHKLVAGLLEEAEQKQAPINLPLVASFRGIIEIAAETMNGPAMLLPTSKGLKIRVNSSDSSGRRNFSTAHEICHTLFPSGTKHIVGKVDSFIGHFYVPQEEEYLCDIGASCLLLPPHLVSPEVESYGRCLDAIIRLAEEFQSSIEAAAIAWAQASPWQCAVVFFEEKLKPVQIKMKDQFAFPSMDDMKPEPELRIVHVCPSSAFPFFLPPHKSVSRDGPIYRCMKENRTVGEDVLELREEKRIHTESIYAPYRKEGRLQSRVISLISLS